MVDVWIGPSHARISALNAAKLAVPHAQFVRGLIDTGASHTCVDPAIFTAMGIQPTGTVQIHTPSTGTKATTAFTYDVGLIIPHTGVTGIADGLTMPNLQVSACELFAASAFHVLIGRDVLAECVLSYNGSMGTFTLAY